jgi:glycosyltransferase involved in cell wall biosynthesis
MLSALLPRTVAKHLHLAPEHSPRSWSLPAQEAASPRRKVLLVSNRVMHYRIPVYNWFARRFAELGWELVVRGDQLQKENLHKPVFDFKELEFGFAGYKAEIQAIDPDVVILFLHLRDRMIWPLVHWLKLRRIPVVLWSKALNYDQPDSLLSRGLYKYMHSLFDGLILYSEHELPHLSARHRRKAFPANNTVNFESYPEIVESKEEIKRELGIPFDKVVLSVGRMNVGGQRKKVGHLIDVFKQIETPGVGLVIVGSGVSPELLNAANARNTLYLGEIHDPRDIQISRIFKMADVFSIPGHAGLGLNQAFYWGLPVVTEAGRHPPEIHYLVDGRNGYIVPENDVNQLRRKILHLLEDDRTREEFSRNARADIHAHASIGRMFQGFRDCIDAMGALGRRRGRAPAKP